MHIFKKYAHMARTRRAHGPLGIESATTAAAGTNMSATAPAQHGVVAGVPVIYVRPTESHATSGGKPKLAIWLPGFSGTKESMVELLQDLAADGFVEGFPNPVIFAESFAKPVVPADGADGWSAPKNARAPTPQPSAWKDILAGLADSEAAVSQQRAAVDDDFAADFAKLWAEAEAEKLAPPVRRPTSTGFVGHLHHAQAPPSPPHPHGTAAPEPAALYQAAPAATAVHRGAMIPAVGGEGAVFAASVEAVLLSQAFASRRASARAVPPSSALADCHPQRVSTHNITRWGRVDSPALV